MFKFFKKIRVEDALPWLNGSVSFSIANFKKSKHWQYFIIMSDFQELMNILTLIYTFPGKNKETWCISLYCFIMSKCSIHFRFLKKYQKIVNTSLLYLKDMWVQRAHAGETRHSRLSLPWTWGCFHLPWISLPLLTVCKFLLGNCLYPILSDAS